MLKRIVGALLLDLFENGLYATTEARQTSATGIESSSAVVTIGSI
ncbi:MAG TPA: hypothetical protein VN345_03215 [Blastocatellia bacterium]|nr:hypothetical protein [Blastocatellia bacterium]